MYQEALAELNKARPISDPPDWSWIIAEIAYVKARIGDRAAANQMLEELKARATREYLDPAILAYIYIGLGESDQAFAYMERAYQEHSGAIGWLQVEPHFDPLRSDPRFAALVRRMGLKDPPSANDTPL